MTDLEIYKSSIRQEALNAVNRTVGFAEAEDRKSFVIGAEVAIDKTFELMQVRITSLEYAFKSTQTLYEETIRDMRTLTGIINKYTDKD